MKSCMIQNVVICGVFLKNLRFQWMSLDYKHKIASFYASIAMLSNLNRSAEKLINSLQNHEGCSAKLNKPDFVTLGQSPSFCLSPTGSLSLHWKDYAFLLPTTLVKTFSSSLQNTRKKTHMHLLLATLLRQKW